LNSMGFHRRTSPPFTRTVASRRIKVPPLPTTSQPKQGNVSPKSSARRNVIESERYDRVLQTRRAFRQARMRKECGPITDPPLGQSCLASFKQDEPYSGSSYSTAKLVGVLCIITVSS
jgi:hypothetical protein